MFEKRRATADAESVHQRRLPGIYIIDAGLNVLYHRPPHDHEERRTNYRFDGARLPHGLGPLVRAFWHRSAARHEAVENHIAADGSLLLRISWIHGLDGQAACVMFERFNKRNHVAGASHRYGLSKREAHVLQLLFEGLSTDEIAHRLSVSRSTALFHISNLLNKTGSRNRSEMISKAIG